MPGLAWGAARAPGVSRDALAGVWHGGQSAGQGLQDDLAVGLGVVGALRAGSEAGVAEHLEEQFSSGVAGLGRAPALLLGLREVPRRAAVRCLVAAEAVLRFVTEQRDLAVVGVARVGEVAVVAEGVVQQGVTFGIEYAAEAGDLVAAGALAGLVQARLALLGVRDEQDAPGPVAGE